MQHVSWYINRLTSLPTEQCSLITEYAQNYLQIEELQEGSKPTDKEVAQTIVDKWPLFLEKPLPKECENFNLMRRHILNILWAPNHPKHPKHVLIAVDIEGRLQGVLIYDALKVDNVMQCALQFLLSAPENIDPNKLAKRTCKGAGRALVLELIDMTRNRNWASICLHSTPLAIPFYKKLGFLQDDKSDTQSMTLKLSKK